MFRKCSPALKIDHFTFIIKTVIMVLDTGMTVVGDLKFL